MNPRNEPSPLQIVLDELRAFRNEVRIEVSAARLEAADAHKRIDKYENRFWGWICGIGGLGAAGGMTFGEGLKHAVKALVN